MSRVLAAAAAAAAASVVVNDALKTFSCWTKQSNKWEEIQKEKERG